MSDTINKKTLKEIKIIAVVALVVSLVLVVAVVSLWQEINNQKKLQYETIGYTEYYKDGHVIRLNSTDSSAWSEQQSYSYGNGTVLRLADMNKKVVIETTLISDEKRFTELCKGKIVIDEAVIKCVVEEER